MTKGVMGLGQRTTTLYYLPTYMTWETHTHYCNT